MEPRCALGATTNTAAARPAIMHLIRAYDLPCMMSKTSDRLAPAPGILIFENFRRTARPGNIAHFPYPYNRFSPFPLTFPATESQSHHPLRLRLNLNRVPFALGGLGFYITTPTLARKSPMPSP